MHETTRLKIAALRTALFDATVEIEDIRLGLDPGDAEDEAANEVLEYAVGAVALVHHALEPLGRSLTSTGD
jgi:hypothetical protein